MAESPSELRAEIEKLERKHSENPEGRFFVPLANAYRKSGEVDRAESLLREGLTRHPEYLSAHIVLGRCLIDRGAEDGAAAEFRYVLSVDPQNLIALRTMGELALSAGRLDEARGWYEELLSVDPLNEEARRALDALRLPETEFDESADWDADWWGMPRGEAVGGPEAVAGAEGELQDEGAETGGGGELAGAAAAPRAAGDDDDLELLTRGLPGVLAGEVSAEPAAPGADVPVTASPAPLEPEAADGPYGDDEEPEVVTETIAELYARQGLPERAIGVYRELIRRRGGDEALERRLRQLERQVAGVPEPTAEPEFELAGGEPGASVPHAGHDDAPPGLLGGNGIEAPGSAEAESVGRGEAEDVFAASVSDGFDWPAREVDLENGEGNQHSSSLPAASRGAASTIADELRALAGWTPPATAGSIGAGAAAAPPVRDSAPDPALEPEQTEEPWGFLDELDDLDEPGVEEPGSPAGTPAVEPDPEETHWLVGAFDEPPFGTRSETPDERSAPEEPEDVGGAAGAATGREPMPWEAWDEAFIEAEPPGSEGHSAAAKDASGEVEETIRFPWEEDGAEDDRRPAGGRAEAPTDPAAGPAPTPPAEPAPPPADDEDDDLESFQAWLRSLKR